MASGGAPASSRSLYTRARSPSRMATPAPNRSLSRPARPRRSGAAACVLDVHGVDVPWRRAEPSMTSSWRRAAAWSISSAAPASITAGRRDRPRTRRRPSSRTPAGAACPRPARGAQGAQRTAQVGIDVGPAFLLRREQLVEPRTSTRRATLGDRCRQGRGCTGFHVWPLGSPTVSAARPSRLYHRSGGRSVIEPPWYEKAEEVRAGRGRRRRRSSGWP
jgi:hypothetical protein